ncbi:unnamed protein product [Pipistrellus nathusii]|uniref:Androgen receptor n=1 Tax=Pipistrellus nathusii TaxID=59473 RepID=A0ABP0A965_PIPNA
MFALCLSRSGLEWGEAASRGQSPVGPGEGGAGLENGAAGEGGPGFTEAESPCFTHVPGLPVAGQNAAEAQVGWEKALDVRSHPTHPQSAPAPPAAQLGAPPPACK